MTASSPRTASRTRPRSGAHSGSPLPDLRIERGLLRAGVTALACVDEAGRGALAGPVSVGIVVVTAQTLPAPRGVRDSKLLSPSRRTALVPQIHAWAGHAVGMAGAWEIDQWGIMAAMRLAGERALAALPVRPDCVLLDGNVDYLSRPDQPGLFDAPPVSAVPKVLTRVQADLQCAGVAAASILAKTARDQVMVELHSDFPMFDWAANKAYAAPVHLAALRRCGPSPHHRVSWRLPAPAGDRQE